MGSIPEVKNLDLYVRKEHNIGVHPPFVMLHDAHIHEFDVSEEYCCSGVPSTFRVLTVETPET